MRERADTDLRHGSERADTDLRHGSLRPVSAGDATIPPRWP